MASMNVRPIPEIFTDVFTQLTALVRKEGQLARTEISEKVSRALAGMAMILLGAVLLIPALVILLEAAIAGLVENGMEPALASVIVGGVALALGMVLGLAGWRRLKPAALVPDKTIDQLRRDAAVPRHAGIAATYAEQEMRHGDHRDRAA